MTRFRNASALLVVGLALSVCAPTQSPTHAVRTAGPCDLTDRLTAYAILGATVIDGTGAPPAALTIVVRDKRIADVGTAGTTKIPPDACTVDSRGTWIIPGLWDAHAHVVADEMIDMFIANGVTGVRDMGGPIDQDPTWFDRLRRSPTSPHIVTPMAVVDGPRPMIPGSIAITTADDARRAVRSLRGRGADFIKVYNIVPRDAFLPSRTRHTAPAWPSPVTSPSRYPPGKPPLRAKPQTST